MSWKQIALHWGAYRRAFHEFDVSRVAAFDEADVQRALEEPGVLRSPRKVRAVVANAKALLEIERERGIRDYLRSFDGYQTLARDIQRRFSFMGPMNVWYFLFRGGEPVPEFESWVLTIEGEHPRMREMVERARTAERRG